MRNVYLSVIFISISLRLSNTEHLFFYEPSVFGYYFVVGLFLPGLYYVLYMLRRLALSGYTLQVMDSVVCVCQ